MEARPRYHQDHHDHHDEVQVAGQPVSEVLTISHRVGFIVSANLNHDATTSKSKLVPE